MSEEHDTVEVIDLTLQQVCHTPDMRYRGDIGNHLSVGLACTIRGQPVTTDLILGQHLHRTTLMGVRILEDIDTAKAFFYQIVETFLVFQVLHLGSELVKFK